MDFVKRYHLIKEACLKARAEGLKIVPGRFGGKEYGECCPLTAFDPEAGADTFAARVALAIVEPGWEGGFVDGFDGNKRRANSPVDAYCLGQCLRAEFL